MLFYSGRILATSVPTGEICRRLTQSLFAREQQLYRQHCSVVSCWIFDIYVYIVSFLQSSNIVSWVVKFFYCVPLSHSKLSFTRKVAIKMDVMELIVMICYELKFLW